MNTPFPVNQKEIDEKVKFLSSAKCNHTQHMYIDITGDLVQGTLLARIMYWFSLDKNNKSKVRIFKDGYFWIAKQRRDWWEEIRITERQYDKAISELKKKGFVELAKYKFNSMPTIHIRPNYDNINSATKEWEAKLREEIIADYQSEFQNNKNGNYEKCNSHGINTKCNTGITQEGNLLTLITNNDYNNIDYNKTPKSSTAKALEDNIPSSFQRNKGNRSSKNQLTEGDTEYTKPEIHKFLKQKIHEQMEYSEVGLDKYFESCITPIVIYFYDSYNETFIEQHPVLSNIAYRKIIDAYLNPPKVMENEDIDLETYKRMIDKYFATDIGKRSGKKVDYHINHFMGKQVREYMYHRIMDDKII